MQISIKNQSPFQQRLNLLMMAFAAASLVHFIHNAEFINEYPGLPKNWTTKGVYGAWLIMTLFGFIAWWLTQTKLRTLGLVLVMLYALCGLDSLGHYWVAPFSAHRAMMNLTILFEVLCALALFLYVGFYLSKLRQ
jgi:hypothetical protein